jgi:hypothetical protein
MTLRILYQQIYHFGRPLYLFLSLCWTVYCILLHSVWTGSTTARSVLQPNTDSVRSSEDVFSFIRDGPSSNLDKCSQCCDCTVCCFPSAFPVLSQYLKIDHVCSLLNHFQFILLTTLQLDDVYCDVRCWQCLYLPQTCRTAWQTALSSAVTTEMRA